MSLRRAVLAGLLGVVGLTAAPVQPLGAELEAEPGQASFYKWVDENGVAHYTTDPERIPAALRDGLRQLGHPGDDLERGTDTTAPKDTDWWVVRDAPTQTTRDNRGVDPVLDPYTVGPQARAERGKARAALDEQIATLEQEISRDEDFLKDLISDPVNAADPLAIGDDPDFREVARRLPGLQADLRTLREERERLDEP